MSSDPVSDGRDPAGLAGRLLVAAAAAGFVRAGIVQASDLSASPPEADPGQILPGYRAVVLLATGPAGVVATGPTGPVMLASPQSEGMLQVRAMIEGGGWRVVPLAGKAVSLPRLAEAAGLGWVGPVGALAVAGHGLRLTLFALATDAPLPSSRPAGWAPASPEAELAGAQSDAASATRAVAEAGKAPAAPDCLECGRCTDDCPAMLPGEFCLSWCTACGVCVAVCPA